MNATSSLEFLTTTTEAGLEWVNGTAMAAQEDAEGDWVATARFYIEGVSQLIVGLGGLIGNFISIAVLLRKDMDLKPTFRQILIALISFDIGCIFFNIFLFSMPYLSHHYKFYVFPYIVPSMLPLAQIALTGSIYTTLAVAIERYVSVCHPHRTPWEHTGIASVIGLMVFSVLININRFLEFETTFKVMEVIEKHEDSNISKVVNVTVARPSTTELRNDPLYIEIIMISMLIITGIVPLVVLCALNTKIYLAIRTRTQRLANMTSKQRRDFDVAAVLVGIILVFIFCHSFKFFVNCYEAYIIIIGMDAQTDWNKKVDVVVSVSHLLATVNSSLNFLIYCYKDAKFRSSLIKMFGCQNLSIFQKPPQPQQNQNANNCRPGNHIKIATVNNEVTGVTKLNDDQQKAAAVALNNHQANLRVTGAHENGKHPNGFGSSSKANNVKVIPLMSTGEVVQV